MNITPIVSQVKLRTLAIKPPEIKEALSLLGDLSASQNAMMQEAISIKIFEIFDKYLKEKAFRSSGKIFKEDFLQKIYLSFFELLEKVKCRELEPGMFLETLDKTTIDSSLFKSGVGYTKSLNEPRYNNNEVQLIDYLTEDDLPIYAAAPDDEKIEADKNSFLELLKKNNLQELEMQVMVQKGAGKDAKEISQDLNKNYWRVLNIIKSTILKMQDNNGVLPEGFKSFVDEFKNKCAIEDSEDNIKNVFINKACAFRDYEKVLQRVRDISDYFNVEGAIIAKMFLENTRLFKTEIKTIETRIKSFSDFFGIEIGKVKKSFCENSMSMLLSDKFIQENIINSSRILDIDPKQYANTFLRCYRIIRCSGEEIKSNLESVSKYLGISFNKYKKFALVNPKLFILNQEFLQCKLQAMSDMLGVSEAEFLKYAKFHPNILLLKPDTVYSNVENIAKTFGVEFNEAVKIALYNPALLYSKIDTITSNLDNAARLIGMDKEDYYNIASRQPTIITRKPESIRDNVFGLLEVFGYEKEEFFELLKTFPMLIYTTPETQLKKAKIVQYYKEIAGKGKLPLKETAKTNISVNKLYLDLLYQLIKKRVTKQEITKKNFLDYLNQNPGLDFKFIIQNHECVEEFISFIKDFSMKTYKRQRFEFVVR